MWAKTAGVVLPGNLQIKSSHCLQVGGGELASRPFNGCLARLSEN